MRMRLASQKNCAYYLSGTMTSDGVQYEVYSGLVQKKEKIGDRMYFLILGGKRGEKPELHWVYAIRVRSTFTECRKLALQLSFGEQKCSNSQKEQLRSNYRNYMKLAAS